MTITLERPLTATSGNGLHWRAHQAGVWVAHDNHRFMGMVEARWGKGFVPTTRLGKQLGLFRTVEEAQAALERECS
jgi:hypothetical protein